MVMVWAQLGGGVAVGADFRRVVCVQLAVVVGARATLGALVLVEKPGTARVQSNADLTNTGEEN